jgi:sRNA-binding protein
MPEIGLGIGYERGDYGGITRDWLYWYDENNQRYPTPSEWVQLEQQQTLIEIAKTKQAKAESEQARAESEQARAESEQARAESEQAKAESEQAKAESEQTRKLAEKLAAKLRTLGIDPDEV